MRRTRPLTRRPGVVAASFILLFAAGGCDALLSTDEDLAENAQVIITGTSVVPLRVIMSNQFLPVQDPGSAEVTVALLDADTVFLSPPIDQTYPMGPNLRFFVRVTNPDSSSTADLNLRVLLDGKEEVYNVNVTLKDASIEYVFTYF